MEIAGGESELITFVTKKTQGCFGDGRDSTHRATLSNFRALHPSMHQEDRVCATFVRARPITPGWRARGRRSSGAK